MPTDNRATAERIAQEVYEQYRKSKGMEYSPLAMQCETLQERAILCVLAGMAHRDRTAEREAARKAWDAAVMAVAEFTHDDPRAITYQSLGQYRSALSRHMETVIKHDLARYLAAEFGAGERVTPEESAVWEAIGRYGAEIATSGRMAPPAYLTDAVKRLAEQRGAER